MRTGTIGKAVSLKVNFYANGVLFDPLSINSVNIYNVDEGGLVVETLTPSRLSEGVYEVKWTIPSNQEPGVYYDEWTWVATSGMSETTRRYCFSVLPEGTAEQEPTRVGIIGQSVSLAINFYVNGNLFDPHSVSPVEIYTESAGGELVELITPERISLGYYEAVWDIPSGTTRGTYYDEWTWVAVDGMAENVRRYSFEVCPRTIDGGVVVDNVAAICRIKPRWFYKVGLQSAVSVGNGVGMRLDWGDAIPVNYNNTIHYNVYYSSTRFGVFSEGPKAVTLEKSAVINSFTPGKLKYLAVRITEFNPAHFDITELDRGGLDVYMYPERKALSSAISSSGESDVAVGDTLGYPDVGYVKINSEILRYGGRDGTTFFVDELGRGAYGTFTQAHAIGDEVSLWQGVEDENSVIVSKAADWHHTHGVPQLDSAIGKPNADADGYRSIGEDIITTDMSARDEENIHFPAYDYFGYHRPSLQDTFSGECVSSYAGGEFDGGRGLFLNERNLARLDVLLQLTGQRAILLKRRWSGKKCRCAASNLRVEHPNTRCQYCYGVGFDGGYDRYVNPRPISESVRNTQGLIMIRVEPYTDDVDLVMDQGLRSPVNLKFWTLSVPTIKDRDCLAILNKEGEVEWIYECLNVTRNVLFMGDTGRQAGEVRRQDKTDVLYQYRNLII